jgi:hypothetical protein
MIAIDIIKKNLISVCKREREKCLFNRSRWIIFLSFFFYQDVTRGNVTKRSAVTSCFLSMDVRCERGCGHFSN